MDEKEILLKTIEALNTTVLPIALKRYHCSVLSGTIVALRAVPLISL